MSRRHFVRGAAASLALPVLAPGLATAADKKATPPSERIGLGFIGVGTQNRGHLGHFAVNGITFFGSDGKVFVNRGFLRSSPEDVVKQPLGARDVRLYRSPGHQRDWIECVRSRRRPIADVEIGAHSVTVCHLGNLAYWHHRKLRWDPQHWQFVGDAGANKWLDREHRDPWKLPAMA